MPPRSPLTRRRRARPRTSSMASGFTPCWRSSTMVTGAPESPLWGCCAPGGPPPTPLRSRVLVRGDSGSGVQPLLRHVHDLGLAYSVGFSARQPVQDALAALPKQAWRAARDPDGRPRDGAQVAELTRWMPPTLTGWPPGMRIIARRERPHPGAQLHITDDDGWR